MSTSSLIGKEAADLERAKECEHGGDDVLQEENGSLHNDEDVTSEEETRRFLLKLKGKLVYNDYMFQKIVLTFNTEDELCDKAGPVMEGMDLGAVKHYSYSDLKQMTNSFNESNLIRKTIFGRLFHAKIGEKDILVKTWDVKPLGPVLQVFDTDRIADELTFLRYPALVSHPNVVKLIGYSCEKKLAVIYEETRPKCLLEDIIASDEFGWEDRLKVAFEIASVVKTFHKHGTLHRGFFPDFFLIYEGYSAKCFDFNFDYFNGLWRHFYLKLDGEPTTRSIPTDDPEPEMSRKEDVFGFGFLLLQLVSKSWDYHTVYRRWGMLHFDSPFSPPLIHESFQLEEEIASKIKNLVISCLNMDPDGTQPSMGDVVDILGKLVHV